MTMVERVWQTIQQYHMVSPEETVVVGVSGGADSMALLHILRTLQNRYGCPKCVLAAHVQHHLRGEESLADEAYVRRICSEWDVELLIHQADVSALAARQGRGLEETGRQVRYAFFEEIANAHKPCRIATAHNRKDNLETVLLHLTRGSGLQGGGGIAPVRDTIIRPLLFCAREDIEAYCQEQGIDYRQDSTNQDVAYCRNRIRQEVIPPLSVVNPRVEEAFLRFSEIARQDNDCLQIMAEQTVTKAKSEKGYVRSVLAEAHPAIATRALRLIAEREGCFGLETEHVRQLTRLLVTDGSVTLPGNRLVVSRKGLLRLAPMSWETMPKSAPLAIQAGSSYTFCGKIYNFSILSLEEYEKQKNVNKNLLKNVLDYAMIHHSLYMRSRKPGDRYQPVGRPTKSLKKLLNEAGIPVWERNSIPVLCDQTGIVWTSAFGCDQRTVITEDTQHVLLITVQRDV